VLHYKKRKRRGRNPRKDQSVVIPGPAVATENASWDNACAILDMREKPVKRTFHVTATERVSAKADNAIVFQVTKGNLAKRRVFAQTNVVAMVYVPVQHATVFQDGLGTAAQRIPKKQKSKLV